MSILVLHWHFIEKNYTWIFNIGYNLHANIQVVINLLSTFLISKGFIFIFVLFQLHFWARTGGKSQSSVQLSAEVLLDGSSDLTEAPWWGLYSGKPLPPRSAWAGAVMCVCVMLCVTHPMSTSHLENFMAVNKFWSKPHHYELLMQEIKPRWHIRHLFV